MRDCQDIRGDLSELFTGGLSAVEKREVEGHLAACAECRQRVAELKVLFEVGSSLAGAIAERVPSDLSRRVRERIESGKVGLARPRKSPRRLHRRFLRRKRRPSVSYAFFAVAAAAAVLLAVVALRSQRDESAHGERVGTTFGYISLMEGSVEYSRAGSTDWLPAAEDTELADGYRLRTGSGRARVGLTTGTVLFVDEFTTLGLDWDAELARGGLSISAGRIYVETVEDRGFYVETPHGRIVALGTRFGIETEIEGTTVVVAEGKVGVATGAGRAEVGTGEEVLLARWTIAPGPVRKARDLDARIAWTRGLKGARTIALAKRETEGLVALYAFNEGGGTTVRDVSGVGEPLNLTVEDPAVMEWIEGGGIAVRASSRLVSDAPARKIVQACKAANELTVEAWVKPAGTKYVGPSRIVALSRDALRQNFILGMNEASEATESYSARFRTTVTTEFGSDPHGVWGRSILSTPEQSATTELTHVVFTRDSSGATRFFLDGKECAAGHVGGDCSNWSESYHLALCNENKADRTWLGEVHLVAIYARALGADEVERNFGAGLGPLRGTDK